jgi:chemotaxis protein histidine kinase CheA
VIDDRLKQLGELYLLRTREELALLRAEVAAARQGQAEPLLIMQRGTHRISGSGAMLGFKAASEAAGKIERILRRADPVPTEDEWAVIMEQLDHIEAGLAQQSPNSDAGS